jgi:tetratricopeptide (TPR) repeat protein
LAIMLCSAKVALADGGTDDEEGRAAMRRGVAAFGRGDAETALAEYETAKRLVPHANAPYLYAAEALLTLERYPQAVENLERYLAKNPDVSDAGEVRNRIARIKADHYAGHLHVVSNVDGATVLVDGEARGAVRDLDLKPGPHRLELRADAHEPLAQEVDIVGDRDATLVFTLAERVAPRIPVELPPQRRAEPPPPWRTVGWIGTAAGATTLAVSFLVDVAALGPKISDYRAAADRGDPAARGLRDDATSLRTLTAAGYVTGGVLAAGGVSLLLFAPRAAPVALTPWATPSAAGVGFRSPL